MKIQLTATLHKFYSPEHDVHYTFKINEETMRKFLDVGFRFEISAQNFLKGHEYTLIDPEPMDLTQLENYILELCNKFDTEILVWVSDSKDSLVLEIVNGFFD